jgi:hydroxyacylglutathione hydrolase
VNLDIQVARVVSVPLEENAYVAWVKGGKECFVVDPGLEPEKIIEHIERQGLELAAILNTHGHFDHVGGNEALKERWPNARLIIGKGDAPKLTDPYGNLSGGFALPMTSPAADEAVTDGETFTAAGIELEVLEVPGHSAGHVVFLCRQHDPLIAFVGDVIFAGGIGRTDFPDGNYDQLIRGIRTRLYTLPGSTVLLSGHGPETTVGEEKRSNPFVRG